MIANSDQALAALRHKRTGEVLPTKNIARNTKLVYFCDELVGLKFHDTIIALYQEDGVRLDTRGDIEHTPFGQGWFTLTTWARIGDFTLARTHTAQGLRYVNERLYVPGMTLDTNGEIIDGALHPAVEKHITNAVHVLPGKMKRHAMRVAKAWAQDWRDPLDCCSPFTTDGAKEHYLDHIEANEVAVPCDWDCVVAQARRENRTGDSFIKRTAQLFWEQLRGSGLVTIAVKSYADEFPYPQLPRRRRFGGELSYAS